MEHRHHNLFRLNKNIVGNISSRWKLYRALLSVRVDIVTFNIHQIYSQKLCIIFGINRNNSFAIPAEWSTILGALNWIGPQLFIYMDEKQNQLLAFVQIIVESK